METPRIEDLSIEANSLTNGAVEDGPAQEPPTLYPKILKLTDFLYHAKSLQPPVDSIQLTGSVKLHGTHADIVFINRSDEIRLQSRNQLTLTPVKDNAGFAAFIAASEKKPLFNLRDRILGRYHDLNPEKEVVGDLVIAGEWCGSKIQKKVALANIPRFFAIISININDSWVPDWKYADISNEDARIFHISKAGFFTQELNFDDISASEAYIKGLTDAVEKECPFAKTLGVSGLGEGIVWKATNHCGDPKFWFKSKGDILAVSNSSKLPASAVDKENRERVENFAKAIVTENRLEQGWEYLEQKNMSGTGAFLKWMANDCFVEEEREMEALNISRSKLSPAIAYIAKPWFWARVERAGKEADKL